MICIEFCFTFFSSSSLVLMKAYFKACIWRYLPEASVPFTASKTECQPRKETKLQLPFSFYVFILFFLVFFEGKVLWNVITIRVTTYETQNYRNTVSESFFRLVHPEDGIDICLLLSMGLPLVLHGIPKIPDCLHLMTSTNSFRPLGCFPSSATLHLPVPGVILFSLRFFYETQAPEKSRAQTYKLLFSTEM